MDLEAEFKYASLEDLPLYDAISYSWGKDRIKDRHLILHNKQFLVTSEVHDILIQNCSWFGPRLI